MVPLVLLLQLSLVVVITRSQQYDGSNIYEETSLTEDDFANAANGSYLNSIPEDLKSANHCRTPLDTDEQGHYFEGNGSDSHRTRRNAVGGKWERGEIPYMLSGSYWWWQRGMIAAAMKEIEDKTCVLFVTKNESHQNYLFFGPINGCESYPGLQNKGKQDLSLTYWCFYHGTILHELMHALGFHHEHQREDRDTYIHVNVDNIRPEYRYAYDIVKGGVSYGLPYDPCSITHYSSWNGCACSWGWHATMVLRHNHVSIPEPQHLSKTDAKRVDMHYKEECKKTYLNAEDAIMSRHPSPWGHSVDATNCAYKSHEYRSATFKVTICVA